MKGLRHRKQISGYQWAKWDGKRDKLAGLGLTYTHYYIQNNQQGPTV